MTAATLLDRLEAVRQIGPGRWLARCPAHQDRRASLSVRELDDGTVLLHDFAGCAVADVVAAVGLELHQLFPPRTDAHAVKAIGRRGRRVPAIDALRAISFECDLVAICAGRLAAGHPLTDDERARLLVAAGRIGAATIEAGCHA